jgi:hypothetical protein
MTEESIYDRPWIAMNAAHVRAEAAISTRNGLTVDFADFAIATLRWCQVKAMTELVSATLSDADCTAVYLFHDRVPYSRVTLPDPARAIRDDHHDLEHFEPLLAAVHQFLIG